MKGGTERMDIAQYREEVGLPQLPSHAPVPKPKSEPKYKNKPVKINGIRFDSLLEGAYYLAILASDSVLYHLRQVPIDLPGNTRYRVDFQVFLKSGAIQYIDAKGRETEVFKLKKRQVEDLYPIKIQCVRRDEIPKHFLITAKELQNYE